MNRTWLTSGILVLALAVQAQAQSLVFSNDTAGVFSSVNFNAVTVAGNRFVAVGTNSTIWTFALNDTTATNGWLNSPANWTKAATSQFPSSSLNFGGLTTGGAQFVTGGTSNLVFTSSDGVTWTGVGKAFANTLEIKGLAESDTGNYVAAAIGLDITYTNGLGPAQNKGWLTATINNPVPYEGYFGLASFGSSGLIVCGFGGVIRTSTDSGVHWSVSGTNSYLFSNTNLLAAGTDGTNFVVVGGGGTIKYCANGAGGGTAWTTAHVGVNNLNAIAWTGSEYIVGGNGGTILTSPDGVNWTSVTSPTTANLQGVTFATSGTFQNVALLVGAAGEVVIGGIPPTAAVVNGNTAICNGSSTQVTVNLGGSAGPWTLTLSDGFDSYTTNTSSSTVTFTVTPTNSLPNSASNFTYIVTALTDDITGISAQPVGLTGNFLVTDNPHPTSTLAALNTTNCNLGVTYILTNTLTGLGPWTVVWSSNGVPVTQPVNVSTPGPVQDTFSVTPTNTALNQPATNIYFVMSVSDNSGCAADQPGDLIGTNIIVINPRPTATVGGVGSICNGTPTTISAALTGIGPWTVTWSDGAVSNNVTTSPATHPVTPVNPNLNSTIVTNYSVIALSDANCTAEPGDLIGFEPVTVYPRPTAAVSGSASICNGGTNIILAALTGIGPWNVTWSDGAVSNGVAASPATHPVSPLNPNPNTFVQVTYTVIFVSDAHCTTDPGDITGSAVVTVNPRPTSVLTPLAATNCNVGTAYMLTNILTGIGPWTVVWSSNSVSVTNGPLGLAAPGPFTNTFAVVPTNTLLSGAETNTYYVISVSNNDTCLGNLSGDISGTNTVVVNPLPPAPTFIADQTNCQFVTPNPTLSVTPPAPGPLNGTSVMVNWYDANTKFLIQTSGDYIPTSVVLGTNTFFAQSEVEPTGCQSTNMTTVLLIVQDCLSGTSGWPKIQMVGTNVVVTWLGNVDLQGTNALTAVTNGWTNIVTGAAGVTNTYTNTSSGTNEYYRLFAP